MSTQFGGCRARETFSNLKLSGGGMKMSFSNRKLGISQKRGEIRRRLLLIANSKWRTPFKIK